MVHLTSSHTPLGRNTTSYTPGDQTHVSALYSFVCGTPFSELTIHIIVVCWLIVFETFHFFLASLTFPPPPPLLLLPLPSSSSPHFPPLGDHPDKAWVTWLLNSILYSVSIGFNGPHTPYTARNLPLSLAASGGG